MTSKAVSASCDFFAYCHIKNLLENFEKRQVQPFEFSLDLSSFIVSKIKREKEEFNKNIPPSEHLSYGHYFLLNQCLENIIHIHRILINEDATLSELEEAMPLLESILVKLHFVEQTYPNSGVLCLHVLKHVYVLITKHLDKDLIDTTFQTFFWEIPVELLEHCECRSKSELMLICRLLFDFLKVFPAPSIVRYFEEHSDLPIPLESTININLENTKNHPSNPAPDHSSASGKPQLNGVPVHSSASENPQLNADHLNSTGNASGKPQLDTVAAHSSASGKPQLNGFPVHSSASGKLQFNAEQLKSDDDELSEPVSVQSIGARDEAQNLEEPETSIIGNSLEGSELIGGDPLSNTASNSDAQNLIQFGESALSSPIKIASVTSLSTPVKLNENLVTPSENLIEPLIHPEITAISQFLFPYTCSQTGEQQLTVITADKQLKNDGLETERAEILMSNSKKATSCSNDAKIPVAKTPEKVGPPLSKDVNPTLEHRRRTILDFLDDEEEKNLISGKQSYDQHSPSLLAEVNNNSNQVNPEPNFLKNFGLVPRGTETCDTASPKIYQSSIETRAGKVAKLISTLNDPNSSRKYAASAEGNSSEEKLSETRDTASPKTRSIETRAEKVAKSISTLNDPNSSRKFAASAEGNNSEERLSETHDTASPKTRSIETRAQKVAKSISILNDPNSSRKYAASSEVINSEERLSETHDTASPKTRSIETRAEKVAKSVSTLNDPSSSRKNAASSEGNNSEERLSKDECFSVKYRDGDQMGFVFLSDASSLSNRSIQQLRCKSVVKLGGSLLKPMTQDCSEERSKLSAPRVDKTEECIEALVTAVSDISPEMIKQLKQNTIIRLSKHPVHEMLEKDHLSIASDEIPMNTRASRRDKDKQSSNNISPSLGIIKPTNNLLNEPQKPGTSNEADKTAVNASKPLEGTEELRNSSIGQNQKHAVGTVNGRMNETDIPQKNIMVEKQQSSKLSGRLRSTTIENIAEAHKRICALQNKKSTPAETNSVPLETDATKQGNFESPTSQFKRKKLCNLTKQKLLLIPEEDQEVALAAYSENKEGTANNSRGSSIISQSSKNRKRRKGVQQTKENIYDDPQPSTSGKNRDNRKRSATTKKQAEKNYIIVDSDDDSSTDSDIVITRKKVVKSPPKMKKSAQSPGNDPVDLSDSDDDIFGESIPSRQNNLPSRFDELGQYVDKDRYRRSQNKRGKMVHRKKWTTREEEQLYYGVTKFGEGNWIKISDHFNMKRKPQQMYDKWRNLNNYGHISAVQARVYQLREAKKINTLFDKSR